MAVVSIVINNRYLDSVKLMQISEKIKEKEGVTDALAVVATKENKSILKAVGMLTEEFDQATGSDICLAIKAETEELANDLLKEAIAWIKKGLPGEKRAAEEDHQPRSLESALKIMPDADLVLISVAGRYAGREARKALENGKHVLLFSDNVSIEDERELKEYAVAHDLLMMGPGCGTAIINNIPLAFANSIRLGKIGIVSAAGTGLQEVSSIIHNLGQGISQAFGTGGRDGKKEISGLMMQYCLQYLINDPQTEVIVLISKLPDDEVIDKIWKLAKTTEKPIVINYLKLITIPKLDNIYVTETLSDTAVVACRLLTGEEIKESDVELPVLLSSIKLPDNRSRKYLRGLYSGGTLCYEAQNIFYKRLGRYAFSNAPLHPDAKLTDVWQSKEHTMIDLGEEEFTVGRPHPMIDYSLRIKKLKEESHDPETAVILFDVVLGYGSHPHPEKELAPIIKEVKQESGFPVICSVIGTDEDPQNRQNIIRTLQDSGAIVRQTNAEAVELAVGIIKRILNDIE
ncbi:MAG: acyl-CoA synthetase FdrA [Candidatus Cloacimonetes bacterium]|nr:acyl-CoA synthetase FdrA [Candidatus Cloacimonadota bacterium]